MVRQVRPGGWFVWLALALGAAAPSTLVARPARAQTLEEGAHAEAQRHFAKARELYGQGNYRDARLELLEAKRLDPTSKELVFNLGIVDEKLALFDEALEQFRGYREMSDVTDAEKSRAEAIILRLEGAKKQLEDQKKNEPPPVVEPPPPKETPQGPPPRGRVDGATIGAAGVGIVGLAVGAIFGVKALAERPAAGFTTGRDGTYADLVEKSDSAHTSAVVSDIGFAVGIAGFAAAAVLYFARPKLVASPQKVGLAPMVGRAGGGVVLVTGWP
jgi:tetratricopeptide (TPR) repeat protein